VVPGTAKLGCQLIQKEMSGGIEKRFTGKVFLSVVVACVCVGLRERTDIVVRAGDAFHSQCALFGGTGEARRVPGHIPGKDILKRDFEGVSSLSFQRRIIYHHHADCARQYLI